MMNFVAHSRVRRAVLCGIIGASVSISTGCSDEPQTQSSTNGAPSGEAVNAGRDLLTSARQHRDDGELTSAIIDLKNALETNPDNLEARWILGLVYLDQGNGEAAEHQFQKARRLGMVEESLIVPLTRAQLLQGKYADITADKSSLGALAPSARAEYLALRGDALLLTQEPAEADAAYDDALALDPGNPSASVGKARIAAAAGQIDEAQQWLQTALDTDPDFAPAWSFLAKLKYAESESEGAEQALDRAIDLRVDNVNDLALRALTRIERDDLDGANADLLVLKEKTPKSPTVSYLKGVLHFERGEFAEAQTALEETLNRQRSFLRANFYLGAAHYYQGHLQQAAEYLATYHNKFRGSTAATKLLARTLYDLEKLDDAAQVLEPFVDRRPDDPFGLNLLARIYGKQGKVDEAIALLEELPGGDARTPTAQALLGLAKLAAGGTAEGIALLEEALTEADNESSLHVLLIKSQLALGQADQALEAAERYKAAQPENAAAYNVLGVVHLARGERDAARPAFEKALKLIPGYPGPAHNLAYLALAEGDTRSALDLYKQVLDQHPGHSRTLWKMAALESAAGNDAKARHLLHRAVTENPGELLPRLRMARHLLDQGQPDRALVPLSESLPETMKDEPAYLAMLGQVELASGRLEDALRTVQRLVDTRVDSADAHFLLAEVHGARNDAKMVRRELQEVLALNPKHFKGRIAMARRLASDGELDEAEEVVLALQAEYPDSPEVLAQLAWLAEYQNDSAKAISHYEKAFAAARSGRLAISLALAKISGGDVDGSKEILTSWLTEHPEDAAVIQGLGTIHLLQGDLDKAISLFKQVLDKDPNNFAALNNLAWALMGKEPHEALSYAERAHGIDRDSPVAMETLGVALLDQDSTDRAASLLAQAATRQPDNLNTQYYLSLALSKTGRKKDAIDLLEKIVDQPRNFSARNEAESLLTALKGR